MPDLSLFTQKRELGVATLCVIWDILCAQAVSFYAEESRTVVVVHCVIGDVCTLRARYVSLFEFFGATTRR